MQTEKITVDRGKARELYRKYREHQHYSAPIDQEIQRIYQMIAQGKVVIRAIESIVKAGVGEDGLPKLALARANAPRCWLVRNHDFSRRPPVNLRMQTTEIVRRGNGHVVDLPAGAFPELEGVLTWQVKVSHVPLIPIHLRPKRGIENYHVLYEAVWGPSPPIDPLLLRRIGLGDVWVVVAGWDLTEVERAAMASRINLA